MIVQYSSDNATWHSFLTHGDSYLRISEDEGVSWWVLRWATPGVSENHNALAGLQGGTAGEYYHLTSAEWTAARTIASSSSTGLLSSGDWSTFNNKTSSTRSLTLNGSTKDLSSDRTWSINDSGTQLITGGAVTQNSGTSIDVAAGTAMFYDSSTQTHTPVSWSSVTNYSLAANISAGADASYIFINSTGSVVTTIIAPVGLNLRNFLYLSKVSHRSGGTITNVRDLRPYGEEVAISLMETNYAVGPLNLSGNVISYYGTGLQIQKSAGVAFRFKFNADADRKNPSSIADPALTPITFIYCQRKTGGGVLYTPGQTVVDPAHYDVGNSTLEGVANNKYTIQHAYYFPRTNSIYVFYGRVLYNSMAAAIAAISSEAFDTGSDFFDGAILRSFITLRGNTTDLSVISDAVFTATGKFSGSGSGALGGLINMQGVYDASTQPQIVTSVTGGAVQIKRGTALDADHIFEILNGAGSTTAFLTGSGGAQVNSLSLTVKLADSEISSATTWNAKEPAITAGTIAQYWRGDKSWQTLDKTAVGATTVGGNFFTLANPSAITFPRVNADNTVSTLDAASFRGAISVAQRAETLSLISMRL